MWLLSALFLLRVVGQIVVVVATPQWLPAMDEWQSGLLPYPVLLTAQVLILGAMAKLDVAASFGRWPFDRRRVRLATATAAFAIVYAGGMIVRYGISGHLHPDRRWLPPGMIPIVFHLVLASYLAIVATRLWQASR